MNLQTNEVSVPSCETNFKSFEWKGYFSATVKYYLHQYLEANLFALELTII